MSQSNPSPNPTNTLSNNPTTTTLAVKLVLDGQVHRLRVNRDCHYDELVQLVRTSFPSLASGCTMRFEDDEHECCTITSDVELSEAMSLAMATAKPSLKVFLEQREASHEERPHASIASSQTLETKSGKVKSATCAPVPAASPNHEAMPKERVLTMAYDFLQDTAIVNVLPAVVQSLVMRVGDCVDVNCAQQVLTDLLTQFPVVAAHPLIHSLAHVDCPQRAYVLQKMVFLAPHQSSLMDFLPRGLKSIPRLVQTLSMILVQCLNKIEQGSEPVQAHAFAPLIAQLMPVIGSLMFTIRHSMTKACAAQQAAAPETGAGPSQAGTPPPSPPSTDGKGVHIGIRCDGCQATPILGPRFKCQVCSDYDLCGHCEAKNIHPVTHTLLKMRVPLRTDIHHGVQCDDCQVQPIVGARFKCKTCPNFDLCAQCEAKNEHPQDHALLKLRMGRHGGAHGQGRCTRGRGMFGRQEWLATRLFKDLRAGSRASVTPVPGTGTPTIRAPISAPSAVSVAVPDVPEQPFVTAAVSDLEPVSMYPDLDAAASVVFDTETATTTASVEPSESVSDLSEPGDRNLTAQVAVLESMGFQNRVFNENLLAAFDGDLGRAVNYLVSGPRQ